MTSPRYALLGLSGSLRAAAFSTAVLKTFAGTVADRARLDIADIGSLPLYNQDLDTDPRPAPVAALRAAIAAADGLVIVSTEYNHGTPGVLKNAIDWASRPAFNSPLQGKPVLIATCSMAFTGGVRAQYQIREAFASTLSRTVLTPEIVIGTVHTKISGGRLTDPAVIDHALGGFAALYAEIERARG